MKTLLPGSAAHYQNAMQVNKLVLKVFPISLRSQKEKQQISVFSIKFLSKAMFGFHQPMIKTRLKNTNYLH